MMGRPAFHPAHHDSDEQEIRAARTRGHGKTQFPFSPLASVTVPECATCPVFTGGPGISADLRCAITW